jgi:hypothetical protein
MAVEGNMHAGGHTSDSGELLPCNIALSAHFFLDIGMQNESFCVKKGINIFIWSSDIVFSIMIRLWAG